MTKKYQELMDAINKLAEGQTDTEVLKSLGTTLKQVEELDTEFTSLVESQNALRKDYIEAIKGNSFKGSNEDTNNGGKEVTLEELMMKQAEIERNNKK
jgi:uncharacterized protein YnzC (UPF0291/DUF896 family)